MRILVNGLPYFSKSIVRDLNAIDKENTYVFYNTYYSKLDKLMFMLRLPFCGAVLSFNGVSDKSTSLDWVVRFKKKLIMQWHGTDVLLANERLLNGTIERKYIDYASHLVSAPWFMEELKPVVAKLSYAPFGYVENAGNDLAYEEIKVLTYLADGKEEFYGWNSVKQLGAAQPKLKITVIGSSGKNLNATENIQFLGWVNEKEVLRLMKEHSIFLRLTDHDGKAITVSQALSVGCEVMWTYPYEKCHFVEKNTEHFVDSFNQIVKKITDRGNIPNKENIAFANQFLIKTSVMEEYLKQFKNALHGK